MVPREYSNNVPALDFEDFPFSLELEYLMAVGTGRDENDSTYGSPWSLADLLQTQALGGGGDEPALRQRFHGFFDRQESGKSYTRHLVARCSIPDDHIDPRRSALFMARSVLREARDGDRTC